MQPSENVFRDFQTQIQPFRSHKVFSKDGTVFSCEKNRIPIIFLVTHSVDYCGQEGKLSIIEIPSMPLPLKEFFSLRFFSHQATARTKAKVVCWYSWNIDSLMFSCLHFYHASLVRYCGIYVHFSLASTPFLWFTSVSFNIIFPSMQFHSFR